MNFSVRLPPALDFRICSRRHRRGSMPVILQPEDYDRWLDGETEDVCKLAQPFPSQLMAVA